MEDDKLAGEVDQSRGKGSSRQKRQFGMNYKQLVMARVLCGEWSQEARKVSRELVMHVGKPELYCSIEGFDQGSDKVPL